MNWFTNFLTSTVGRKVLMSLTGLFLISFLIVHLTGNFQLFLNDGGAAFNKYTLFMTTNPLIRVSEILLVIGFGLHIYTAIVLTQRNNAARPVRYYHDQATVGKSPFSKYMVHSGMIVLIFLVLHLANFWAAYHYGEPATDANGLKDMYAIVVETFKNPFYSWFYVLAMVLLGFHLHHGFQSAFQSLGINHKKYTPLIHLIGVAFSIIVPAAFAAMPIFFWVKSLT